jgi:cardiolipin synthase
MGDSSFYRQIPNTITGLRIVLVLPLAWLMMERRYGEALALFVLAGVSDGLDGYLAKHYGWVTRLGSILDPIADKLLLTVGFLVLGWQREIPVWLVIAVIGRDVVIVLGAVAYHFVVGKYSMEPTPLSKLNTFLQIVLLVAVLANRSVLPLGELAIMVLVYLVLATTIISGADYCWNWGVKAWRATRGARLGSGGT